MHNSVANAVRARNVSEEGKSALAHAMGLGTKRFVRWPLADRHESRTRRVSPCLHKSGLTNIVGAWAERAANPHPRASRNN